MRLANRIVSLKIWGKGSAAGLREIYDSGDARLIPAIEADIRACQLAIQREHRISQQAEKIKKLEEECEELKERVDRLEKKLEPGLKKGVA